MKKPYTLAGLVVLWVLVACSGSSGGGTGGSGACVSLYSCCALLEPGEQSVCEATASGGVDSTCSETIAVYQSSGLCGAVGVGTGSSNGTGVGTGTGIGTGTGTGIGTGSGVGTAGGPTILNLSSNVTALTPGEQLIVTAVVSDPQGIGQVVGGTLTDPSGASYGAFQVSTTSGAYSLALTWDAIETVQEIDAGSGGVSRSFSATFYDQAGHTTSKGFSVQLRCESLSDSICGGSCADLGTDLHHCGACATDCASLPMADSTTACGAGTCYQQIWSETIEPCQTVCATAGKTCGCGSALCSDVTNGGGSTPIISCSAQPSTDDYQGVSCACSF